MHITKHNISLRKKTISLQLDIRVIRICKALLPSKWVYKFGQKMGFYGSSQERFLYADESLSVD
jgi:hypothetical protein